MSFQGNLRDFAATEILQLLGSQNKTGCLRIETPGEPLSLHVADGRVVSTRGGRTGTEDPLLRFLLRVNRLSREQAGGLLAIQRESGRDLEDLLVEGHYLESEDELAAYLERQILDDLMLAVQWTQGSYQFDPSNRWPHPPIVRMSVDGALIEALRRVDEHKRFAELKRDPRQILAMRELPDPDADLTEDEGELFELIDGRRTIEEIAQEAPLTEYETYEALQRMHESGWIEVIGRRAAESGARSESTATRPLETSRKRGPSVLREIAVGLAILVLTAGVALGARRFPTRPADTSVSDPFVAAQIRDVRFALELYRRDRGSYPPRMDDLLVDGWLAAEQLRVPGHVLSYRTLPDRESYELELEATR